AGHLRTLVSGADEVRRRGAWPTRQVAQQTKQAPQERGVQGSMIQLARLKFRRNPRSKQTRSIFLTDRAATIASRPTHATSGGQALSSRHRDGEWRQA